MDFYIGLDLGTSNIKGILADENMNVFAGESTPSPMDGDGIIREFDPEEFVARAADVIRRLACQCPGGAVGVKAVSTASASGNTVFLDGDGKPLYKALSWTDRRIVGKTAEYLTGFDTDGVFQLTGWPYIEMFPLTHIAWWKKDRPEMFAKTRMFAMTTEYLQFRMTGKWGIEPSAATTFYLQDQSTFRYAPDYLRYFGISEDMLPPILPERTPLGEVNAEFQERTGLAPGTKFILGSFDHPSCARALGALDEGDLLLSCGTSWAGLFVTRRRDDAIRNGMIMDPYLRSEGNWAAIFAFTQFGEFIDSRIGEYIDNGPGKFDTFGELSGSSIDLDKAVYAPVTDAEACRAVYKELKPREIAASIIFSTCRDVRDRIGELDRKGFSSDRIFMAGGPTQNEAWVQAMADVIRRPVCRLHRQYGGAVGAALMAAIGTGRYRNERDFFKTRQNEYTVCNPR